ncbi:class I SAM-dependent RNA methyltransferase [Treponema sp. OMZ 840]|uniref:THUMP domain-containing class I SAM-dependent RNA methyltransferase n=1 Tax=Treponema sp. OMZ 840 TaxID=244313 RepID=UPI003D8F51C8
MTTLAALCAIGTEKILANEIKKLGFKTCGKAAGRVLFLCPENELFTPNLCLRTADRIYLQAGVFPAEDFDALFDGVYALNWQDFFNKDVKPHIDKIRLHSSKLTSQHSVQSVVHKAVCKKLGSVWHMEVLPESGAQADIRIYIEKNVVSVLLDLSGAPLNRRGYRKDGGSAPIRETLAASLLQFMCWRRKTPFHDPFCGSGTIAIEAALYAYNIPPGFGRRFALENLRFFDPPRADEIKKREAAKIRPEVTARITGTDIDPDAVERARANAERACVSAGRALQLIGSDQRIQRPQFDCAGFTDIKAPYDTGLIIANPPYGERLNSQTEIQALYAQMSCLFTDFAHWDMGFITASNEFENLIGKRAASVKNLKGGNLDTFFYIYQNAPAGRKDEHKDGTAHSFEKRRTRWES